MIKKERYIVRRGLKAELPTLLEGEIGFCIDTFEIFIGSSAGNKPIGVGNALTISNSSINGNIILNGIEFKVFDETKVNHKHNLSDIEDLDITNKANGYVLAYDSVTDKFVSKSLPSSLIGNSNVNGNIIVDGVEVKVYDDSSILSLLNSKVSSTQLENALNNKANINHNHSASDITDFNIASKLDGDVLTYNATTQKFEPKPLPNNTITNLHALSDVDLSTAPQEGQVLKFVSGKWQASSDLVGSGGSGGDVITDNLLESELVELEDTIPPKDVTGFSAHNITKTSLTLKWTISESSDTQQYKIYRNGSLINTLGYIEQSLDITNLSIYTSYTFKITAVDDSGNESAGVIIQAKTLGMRLKMSGLNEYLKTPANITFNEVIMQFSVNKRLASYYLDGRTALPLSSFSTDSNGNEKVDTFFNKTYLNGVEVTPSSGTPWLPDNKEVEVKLTKTSSATGSLNIFANYNGTSLVKGEIARIRFLNQGTIVADFDFQTGTFNDQSGNNNVLTRTGGTFI